MTICLKWIKLHEKKFHTSWIAVTKAGADNESINPDKAKP